MAVLSVCCVFPADDCPHNERTALIATCDRALPDPTGDLFDGQTKTLQR